MRYHLFVIKKLFYLINNNSIIRYIRRSLLYNFIKILVFIISVIYILFLFVPRNAQIVYIEDSANNENSEISIESYEAFISTTANQLSIVLFDEGEIQLESGRFIYKGKEYGEDYRLSFRPIENINNGSVQGASFDLLGNIFMSVDFRLQTSFGDELSTFRKGSFMNPGVLSIDMHGDVYISCYWGNPVLTNDIDSVSITELVALKPSSDKSIHSRIRVSGEKEIRNISFFRSGHASFNRIKNMTLIGTGDLSFLYSLDDAEFKLQNRILKLIGKSTDNKYKEYFSTERLSARIDYTYESMKIYASGAVKGASISNSDLFPSFWGWFHQNIYYIPATLFASIWGAISVVRKETKQ